MAVLRRRGKWIVDVYMPDGRRLRRVSPVQTRSGAKTFEAELVAGASSISTPSSTARRDADERPQPAAAAPRRLIAIPEPEPASTAPGFSDFAVEWLQTYAVINNKPSEVVNKESALRVHIIPFFSNRPIDTITARDIERYKAAKVRGENCRRGPLKNKTINNHLVVIGKMLRTAEEWDLIDRVPKIRRLKQQESAYDWLRPDESKRYLSTIDRLYPQWRAWFWIALRAGLRRGEIFALQWEDVDLDARLLHVRHSAYRGSLVPTKNNRVRVIPMSRQLHAVLTELRANRRRRSTFLFPGADGRLTRHLDHVNRPHKGALRACRLRHIRIHDLRHSFASQLVTAGRSIKEVQELLGHATIQQTMRYAHLSRETMVTAVQALDTFDDDDE